MCSTSQKGVHCACLRRIERCHWECMIPNGYTCLETLCVPDAKKAPSMQHVITHMVKSCSALSARCVSRSTERVSPEVEGSRLMHAPSYSSMALDMVDDSEMYSSSSSSVTSVPCTHGNLPTQLDILRSLASCMLLHTDTLLPSHIGSKQTRHP